MTTRSALAARRRSAAGIPPAAWLNLGVKTALAALILFYLARPDLPQFEGKAMLFRSSLYPLVALLVPAIWTLRGRPGQYPHLPDALLVLPTVLDSAGNAADGFRFDWFGPSIHFATNVLLVVAVALMLASRPLGRLVAAGLAVGLASVLQTIWELLEYGGNSLIGTNLDITYVTTMRNFLAALAGQALGGFLVLRLLARRPELGGRLLAPRLYPYPDASGGAVGPMSVGAESPPVRVDHLALREPRGRGEA